MSARVKTEDKIEMSAETFKIRFGTKVNEIDPIALAASLEFISVSVSSLNAHSNSVFTPKLRVKVPKKGSYELPFSLSLVLAPLFNNPDQVATMINQAKLLVKFIGELLLLKKYFKDADPKETTPPTPIPNTENVSIQIGDGNRIENLIINKNVYNTFANDPRANEKMEKAFETMGRTKEIKDFTIVDGNNKKVAEIPQSEFPVISLKRQKKPRNPNEIIERTIVYPHNLVWDNKSSWKFIYRGKKIPATIKDQAFKQRIKAGEKFANGDALNVDLKIIRRFDNSLNAFCDKAYEIIEVHNHYSRETAEQTEMNAT